GVPHFKDSEFTGEYPFATIDFIDETFPGKVRMTGFNPMIPQNEDDSSIPCALFTFEVKNTSDKPITYSVTGMLENPGIFSSKHIVRQKDDLTTITMYPDGKQKNMTIEAGNMSLSAIGKNISYQQYSFRGRWFDTINVYWDDLHKPGRLKNREFDGKEAAVSDHCLIMSSETLKPGEKAEYKFIISWYYPLFYKYWGIKNSPEEETDAAWDIKKPDYQFGDNVHRWNNYYAKLWTGSDNVAEYIYNNWDRLYKDTDMFRKALFGSTVPSYVLDAVSSTVSVLRSPTCYRLEDGQFYAFEGSGLDGGSCEGTCQHVWNYAYAMPFLYPNLERSIRDLEYTYSYDNGKMGFRMLLPLGIGVTDFRACLDGQMGSVIKVYREWKISGDDEWLKNIWEKVKCSLEYAWSENNPDKWDRDKDGVLEGRQHHTLDMEMFGPSSWLQGLYVLALKAGAEMAEYFGETEKAKEYSDLYKKGKAYLNDNLFTGKYYIQNLDIDNEEFYKYYDEKWHNEIKELYWDSEHKEIKYQIGEGSSIDQALAQWHSNNMGLGEIFDSEKLKTACENLYKNNYKETLRYHFNSNRVFGLNDESATIICSYPKEARRPIIPIVYSDECMNGFEYSAAVLLIQSGLVAKGLRTMKAVRDRYNGKDRNPWNEFECGNNYARSMASFSALNTLSGFEYDLTRGYLGFSPIKISLEDTKLNTYLELSEICKNKKSYFWSAGKAWGTVEIDSNEAKLNILYGEIELEEIKINNVTNYINPLKYTAGMSVELFAKF
ncbi:MAG: hypothetical protein KBT47_09255, partial [Armatimonadetes bacterium]|nr:hypothetical protein [Candidatus Hippobium faecium]